MKYFASLFFFLVLSANNFAVDDVYGFRPEDFGHVAGCNPGIDDTACWQAAINAAAQFYDNNNRLSYGRVTGSPGKAYVITDTLYVCNTRNGMINGNGATFSWQGTSNASNQKPLFLATNVSNFSFKNFYVRSDTSNAPFRPLWSVFEFTESTDAEVLIEGAGLTNVYCPSTKRATRFNSIDNVIAEGTQLGGLYYGARFAGCSADGSNSATCRPGSIDNHNDIATISNSTFFNVTNAAISVEHTQSHQHRLISVSGSGASGNNACFVNAKTGFISVLGGFQSNFDDANFCLDNSYGPFSIMDTNSEKSASMLKVAVPNSDNTFPVNVIIQGGRFAIDEVEPVDSDNRGHIVSFNRLGSIQIKGMHITGVPTNGATSAIFSILPRDRGFADAAVSAIIEGNTFYTGGVNGIATASEWDVIQAREFVTLRNEGNTCRAIEETRPDGTPYNLKRMIDCKDPLVEPN